jgi:hypothetical protein
MRAKAHFDAAAFDPSPNHVMHRGDLIAEEVREIDAEGGRLLAQHHTFHEIEGRTRPAARGAKQFRNALGFDLGLASQASESRAISEERRDGVAYEALELTSRQAPPVLPFV